MLFNKSLIALALATLIVLLPIHSARASTAAAHSSTSTAARPDSSGNGDFGLGLMLGEPTGISMKYWLSRSNALEFGLAYSFSDFFELTGDYLWEFPGAFGGSKGAQFVPYVGVGAALLLASSTSGYPYYPGPGNPPSSYFHGYADSSVALGARIPLGIEFLPRRAPLGVFVELAPGIGLFPGVFAFFQGDIGARFYF